MKQQFLELKNRLDNLKKRTNRHYEFTGESQRIYDKGQIDILQELLSEVEKIEDTTLKTIDEMIDDLKEGVGYASEIRTLERLKSRLYPPKDLPHPPKTI